MRANCCSWGWTVAHGDGLELMMASCCSSGWTQLMGMDCSSWGWTECSWGWTVAHRDGLSIMGMDCSSLWRTVAHGDGLLLMSSVVEPEPPFLAGAGAVLKGAARAPALQLKLQL